MKVDSVGRKGKWIDYMLVIVILVLKIVVCYWERGVDCVYFIDIILVCFWFDILVNLVINRRLF